MQKCEWIKQTPHHWFSAVRGCLLELDLKPFFQLFLLYDFLQQWRIIVLLIRKEYVQQQLITKSGIRKAS